MPFCKVSLSSLPVTWRAAVSGPILSTALKGSAARTMAAAVMFMLGSSDALLEDQIGEAMAWYRREEVRHAGRDHQPVAGMQELEFAAHQLAAAHFLLAG